MRILRIASWLLVIAVLQSCGGTVNAETCMRVDVAGTGSSKLAMSDSIAYLARENGTAVHPVRIATDDTLSVEAPLLLAALDPDGADLRVDDIVAEGDHLIVATRQAGRSDTRPQPGPVLAVSTEVGNAVRLAQPVTWPVGLATSNETIAVGSRSGAAGDNMLVTLHTATGREINRIERAGWGIVATPVAVAMLDGTLVVGNVLNGSSGTLHLFNAQSGTSGPMISSPDLGGGRVGWSVGLLDTSVVASQTLGVGSLNTVVTDRSGAVLMQLDTGGRISAHGQHFAIAQSESPDLERAQQVSLWRVNGNNTVLEKTWRGAQAVALASTRVALAYPDQETIRLCIEDLN